MRGTRRLRWACLFSTVLLLGPITGTAQGQEKKFIAPVSGEVVRKFEAPSHKFGPGHRGIDYQMPTGSPVRASAGGVVKFAGPVATDGLFVTVQHDGGIETTYSFLSRVDVSNGDRVTQNQLLGLTGDGHDSGPSGLHFGAKQNGEYIDPALLLGDLDDITDLLSLVPQQKAGISSPRGVAAPTSGFLGGIPNGFVAEPGGLDAQIGADTTVGPNALNAQLPKLGALTTPGTISGSSDYLLGAGGPRPMPMGSGAGAFLTRPGETETATPQGTASDSAWWASLPPEFRRELLLEDPERWENFSGLTSQERDAINRRLLDETIAELEDYRRSKDGRRELRNQKIMNWAKWYFYPYSVVSRFDREAEIDRKLRSAKALRSHLNEVTKNPDHRVTREDVYLLDFDVEFAGGDGAAVVALGDPQKAEHIGVLVPGINNAVGSIAGSMDDAAVLRAQAGRSVGRDFPSKTSMIVWMGYDNPNGLPDAMNRAEAKEAAPKLASFIKTIRARHEVSPSSPHVTVFGHSYGSSVTGLAALEGMEAEDIVFMGSPGVGRWLVTADDFPQKRIWSAQSPNDMVNAVAGALGIDPSSRAFGARNVPLDNRNRGHSDYIALDSLGTINLARILTGHSRDVQ